MADTVLTVKLEGDPGNPQPGQPAAQPLAPPPVGVSAPASATLVPPERPGQLAPKEKFEEYYGSIKTLDEMKAAVEAFYVKGRDLLKAQEDSRNAPVGSPAHDRFQMYLEGRQREENALSAALARLQAQEASVASPPPEPVAATPTPVAQPTPEPVAATPTPVAQPTPEPVAPKAEPPITADEYKQLVKQLGPKGAEAFAAQHGGVPGAAPAPVPQAAPPPAPLPAPTPAPVGTAATPAPTPVVVVPPTQPPAPLPTPQPAPAPVPTPAPVAAGPPPIVGVEPVRFVTSPYPDTAQALKYMEQKETAAAVRAKRKSLAGEAPTEEEEEETAPKGRSTPQLVSDIGNLTGNRTVDQLGKIMGQFGQVAKGGEEAAALGPLGAAVPIVGAVMMAKAKIDETVGAAMQGIGEFGVSISRIDADGFAKNINDYMIKPLPIVGQYLGQLGDAIAPVIAGFDDTARRLSQYSPQLAVGEAMNDMRNTFREIRRANSDLGSELSTFISVRQEGRERLEDIAESVATALLPYLTASLELGNILLKNVNENAENIVRTLQLIAQATIQFGSFFIPGGNALATTLMALLNGAVQALTVMAENSGPNSGNNDFFDQLFSTAAEVNAPGSVGTQPLRPAPAGPNFPVF